MRRSLCATEMNSQRAFFVWNKQQRGKRWGGAGAGAETNRRPIGFGVGVIAFFTRWPRARPSGCTNRVSFSQNRDLLQLEAAGSKYVARGSQVCLPR